MHYILLLFLLFSSQLNATPTITIDSDRVKLTDFKLEYFIDKDQNLTLQEIEKKNFRQDTSSLSLGIFKEVTWLRFKLHNATEKHQKIYLHNENAYIANRVDFYTLENTKIVNSLHINLRDPTQTDEKMFGTDAVFPISLDINDTKEIYIKSTMFVMQYPHFTLYDEMSSKRQVSKNNSLLFILVGMLISLFLYHFIVYLATRYKPYLYYSLYLFSAFIWESLLSGLVANNFGIYFNNTSEKFLLSITLIPLFLVLFSKSIFNTKKHYRRENRYLNSIIFISICMFIFGLYDLYLTLIFMSYVYIYMFAILFFTTYSILKKGNPFALIFLIANTIFSLFMIVTDLYYMGFINYSLFVFNSASIGVITEAIILSFLLSYRFKILQDRELLNSQKLLKQKSIIQEELEKSRKRDKILFQQQKLLSMSEMIGNIAHQWRQPLSQINSSVLVIDSNLDTSSVNYEKIEEKLIEIENSTLYMSKTIENFKNFFDQNKKEKKLFSIEETINSAVLIIQNSIRTSDISIKSTVGKNDYYYGLEDELQQVLIIILNNANDALVERKIVNPKIKILTTYEKEYLTISIYDNADGIDLKIIDKIFEPYFTTKHKSQDTGLGLYISKLIIEENMFGELSVKSNTKGTCFSIKLPIKEE